jgi:hypothetical protein
VHQQLQLFFEDGNTLIFFAKQGFQFACIIGQVTSRFTLAFHDKHNN